MTSKVSVFTNSIPPFVIIFHSLHLKYGVQVRTFITSIIIQSFSSSSMCSNNICIIVMIVLSLLLFYVNPLSSMTVNPTKVTLSFDLNVLDLCFIVASCLLFSPSNQLLCICINGNKQYQYCFQHTIIETFIFKSIW